MSETVSERVNTVSQSNRRNSTLRAENAYTSTLCLCVETEAHGQRLSPVIRVREFLPQTDTDTNAFANRTVHERLAAPPRLANKQRTTFTNIANCSRTRPQGMHVIQFKNRKVIVGKYYRKSARHAPVDVAGARRCVFDIIAVSTTITGRYSSRHASCVVDLSSLSNLHRA